jgi:N-6 DNA Methylase/HsdM N-terminal domain
MSDETVSFTVPLRRMTQAELDAFLEKAADILRGNVDHSEFRGYVFALLFFKRISDLFEEAVRKLAKQVGDELANDPAMQKKSLPFVVPPDSTWEAVTGGTAERKITSLQLGLSLNDAMLAIERANAPKFDGILTSKIDFNRTDELPRDKLVNLKNHFSSRKFDRAHVPDDLFGDAYEYLIRTFASKAGKSSGEFYTPREISYLMSEIIEPDEQDEVCDWASGSASLLLQCREYLRRHKKDPNRLFLYAQESNLATYNISRINLILHGVKRPPRSVPTDGVTIASASSGIQSRVNPLSLSSRARGARSKATAGRAPALSSFFDAIRAREALTGIGPRGAMGSLANGRGLAKMAWGPPVSRRARRGLEISRGQKGPLRQY